MAAGYFLEIIPHQPSSLFAWYPLSTVLRTAHWCLRMEGRRAPLSSVHPYSGHTDCLVPPRRLSRHMAFVLTFVPIRSDLKLWWCTPVTLAVGRQRHAEDSLVWLLGQTGLHSEALFQSKESFQTQIKQINEKYHP